MQHHKFFSIATAIIGLSLFSCNTFSSWANLPVQLEKAYNQSHYQEITQYYQAHPFTVAPNVNSPQYKVWINDLDKISLAFTAVSGYKEGEDFLVRQAITEEESKNYNAVTAIYEKLMLLYDYSDQSEKVIYLISNYIGACHKAYGDSAEETANAFYTISKHYRYLNNSKMAKHYSSMAINTLTKSKANQPKLAIWQQDHQILFDQQKTHVLNIETLEKSDNSTNQQIFSNTWEEAPYQRYRNYINQADEAFSNHDGIQANNLYKKAFSEYQVLKQDDSFIETNKDNVNKIEDYITNRIILSETMISKNTVSNYFALHDMKEQHRWHPSKKIVLVYISEGGQFHDQWQPEYIGLINEALHEWEKALNNQIHFEITQNKNIYDVGVFWLDQIAHSANGKKVGVDAIGLNPRHYLGKTMVKNNIEIYLSKLPHDNELAQNTIYNVFLHEFGHSLGLTHSDNPSDIMYPQEIHNNRQHLTIRDVNTANMIYQMPRSFQSPDTLFLSDTGKVKKYATQHAGGVSGNGLLFSLGKQLLFVGLQFL